MANFKSIQKTPPVYPISGPGIGGRAVKHERGEVSFATTGTVAIADTIELFDLPRNFRVSGGYVKSLGAAASATITIGDSGNAARYFASTAITTAATSVTLAETGRDYITAAKTTVFATVAGAATGATGGLVVVLTGTIEEPA